MEFKKLFRPNTINPNFKTKMEEDKLTQEKFEQILEEVIRTAKAEQQVEPTIILYTSKENIDTIQQALKEFYSHIKTETNGH